MLPTVKDLLCCYLQLINKFNICIFFLKLINKFIQVIARPLSLLTAAKLFLRSFTFPSPYQRCTCTLISRYIEAPSFKFPPKVGILTSKHQKWRMVQRYGVY